jgi:hypothetical protein
LEPRLGDEVFIKPRNFLKVQVSGIHGRFLMPDGQKVIYDDYYHRRYKDGSIEIINVTTLDEEE